MAFVNTSRFRPFSYEEMVKPLQAYTNEYNAIEQGIGDLSTKASVFDKLANEQDDPEAYNLYKSYADELTNQAGILASQGLTPDSRRSLNALRTRYSTDIVPLEQAYVKREELSKQERELRARDNTLISDIPVSAIKLSDLVKNPTLAPQYISGELISRQVATAAQNLAKSIREEPRKWEPILGGQYFQTRMAKGYSPEEIILTTQGDDNAPKELRKVIDETMESTGIASWNNQDAYDRATEHANRGLWSAIGDTNYQVQSNRQWDLNAALLRETAKKKGSESGSTPPVYRAVQNVKVAKGNTTDMAKDLEFVKDLYNNPDKILQKGERVFPGNISITGASQGQRIDEYYINQEKIEKLAKKYGFDTASYNDIQKFYEDLGTTIANRINTSAVRDFDYKPNVTDYKYARKLLKENARTLNTSAGVTGVYEYEDGEKGDMVKVKDLNKYITDDIDLSYTPGVGITINATDNKGETKTSIIDPDVLGPGQYANYMHAIDSLLEEGNREEAAIKVKEFMGLLYGRFNSFAKVQGETDSKL